MGGVMDFREKSEDELVFGVKAKGAGSQENVSDISSSLSGISIKWEESVKFSDMFGRENWVFGGNIFAKDGFEFFVLDLLLGHDRYFQYNKL